MTARQQPLSDAPPPYRTVVFDCDSTLSEIEGIEELAAGRLSTGDRNTLARLTREAMDGERPLQEVFGARLDLVRPSRTDLERIGSRYLETLLPGALDLVAALRATGTRVMIVSGGLEPAVARVGNHLGLAPEDVFAVGVTFEADGSYRDFDRASPLVRSGGKLELIAELGGAAGLGPLAWIGDGVTDLEAAPECARFIAFGGVERRAAVFERAVHGVTEPDLAALVPLLLAPEAP